MKRASLYHRIRPHGDLALIAACTPSKIRFRSTGNVLDTLQVRIANPDPKTGIGEIQVKGDTVMVGYYRDKQRTKDSHTEDGFSRRAIWA